MFKHEEHDLSIRSFSLTELVDKLPLDYVSNCPSKATNCRKGFVDGFNGRMMKLFRQSSGNITEAIGAIDTKLFDFLEHDDTKFAYGFVREVYTQVRGCL